MAKVALQLRQRPFSGEGAQATVDHLTEEIQELYCSDDVPWVVGYSGGKDSTAVLQLVWSAVEKLPLEKRTKPVYVISTDTLVENPVVATWVGASLETMARRADEKQMPIFPNRLTPEIKDTFWVNLIGRGYPAPRHKFRWCTERLKIKPSNKFIKDRVAEHGEVVLVLGTRKAESAARSRAMTRAEKGRTRDRLSPNASLPNSLIYSPVEDWSNDEVWMYLMDFPNPWGYDNKDLLTMYQGASADGECPLVVDSSTPSCGDSRFGCWTCTIVEKDKSMSAMIQNDEEKEWMLPLLELRDELDLTDDRHLRDFRRMNGSITVFHDRSVHGPYLQEVREMWLQKLLAAQKWIRENGPEYVNRVELITLPELEEIRRIWVFEKREIEDSLPRVYKQECGEDYPGGTIGTSLVSDKSDVDSLREICGDNELIFQLSRDLLSIERQYRTMSKRAGIFEAIEKSITKSFYQSEEDALVLARVEHKIRALRKDASNWDAQNEPLSGEHEAD